MGMPLTFLDIPELLISGLGFVPCSCLERCAQATCLGPALYQQPSQWQDFLLAPSLLLPGTLWPSLFKRVSSLPISRLVSCITADLFGIQPSVDHHHHGPDFLASAFALISGWIMRIIDHLAADLIFAGI